MTSSRIDKEKFFEELNDILKERFNENEIKTLNQNFNKILDKISDQNPFSKPEDFHNQMRDEYEDAFLDKMFANVIDRKSDFIKLGLAYLDSSQMEGEFKKQTDYFFEALTVLINMKNNRSIQILFDDFGDKLEAKHLWFNNSKERVYQQFFSPFMLGYVEEQFNRCLKKHIKSISLPMTLSSSSSSATSSSVSSQSFLSRSLSDPMVGLEKKQECQVEASPSNCLIL